VRRFTFAIHADSDAVAGKRTGERRARELRTLVGVEDFRPAMAEILRFKLTLG
jgi:hypothetical protein